MRFRISRGEVQVPVRPRAMEVLLHLADLAGEVVSKQDLIDAVWRTEFVSDNALTHVIAELRTALGDDAQDPAFIETLPRHGYRLLVTPTEPDGRSGARPYPLVPRSGPRWLAAAAALVVVLGLAVGWLSRMRPTPDAGAHRVVVAVFDNHSGDPTLDSLGLLVADSIASGLSRVEGLEVAINPFGSMGRGALPPVASEDPLEVLAERTRSGLVVAGVLTLAGEELVLEARVVDPWRGEVVLVIDPARAPRTDPTPAVEALTQLLGGALAAHVDATIELGSARPMPLGAYREYRAAMEAWGRDPAVIAHLEAALAEAPDFHLARIMLVWALEIQGRHEEAGEELGLLEAQVGRMTPLDRVGVRLTRASRERRWHDVVREAREAVRLAPGVTWMAVDLGTHLLAVNRPREALAVVEGIPYDWMAAGSAITTWPFAVRARAHHWLGEFEAELEVANESLEWFPGESRFADHRLAALAALGRVDELELAVAGTLATADRGRSSGRALCRVARELRAHGHRSAGQAMAERCVEWYRSRDRAGERSRLAAALYLSGHWEEAAELYQALARERPDDVTYRGLLAVLAARRGDQAEAERLSRELGELDRSPPSGLATFQRACVAAQMGEHDRALDLLSQASAEGFQLNPSTRLVMDLEPLWDDPRFQELIEPKG